MPIDPRILRFGQRVKALRQATPGLTQKALSSAIGTSPSWIVMLETGQRKPSLGLAFALADYFHVPLAWLVSDEWSRRLEDSGLAALPKGGS